jgi:hypothetical protein
MSGGRLVGMISPADLVHLVPVLAEASVTTPATRPDNGALQKAIWE